MNEIGIFTEQETTAVRRLLFRDGARLERRREVVQWWEKRRIPFNIAVGITGIVSLTVMTVTSVIGPGGTLMPEPPLLGIVGYGLIANVMYTGGWMSELLLRPLLGRRTGTVGATIFRYGLVFSVGLTLLPAAAGAFGLVGRTLEWAIRTLG